MINYTIISFAFFESTLPLAKHLSKFAKVTVYSLFSANFLTPPNFDISKLDLATNKIHNFKVKKHHVNDYIEDKYDLNVAVLANNPIKLFLCLKKIADNIKSSKMDCIHFIGDHPSIYLLHWLLQNENCVHTFHEFSLDRLQPKSFVERAKAWIQKDRLKRCIRQNAPIIFHSKNVQTKFLKTFPYTNTFVIPFGLFELYRNLADSSLEKYKNCILFFGYVRPYKGADIFVKAIEFFTRDNPNNKQLFVIAGKGANQFKPLKIDNLCLLDKFLTDTELASLVKHCKAVVVPHRVASQSGIPNTSLVFDKPILCSDIDGLSDIVKTGINGYLFERENPSDMAKKIPEIINLANSNSKHQVSIQNTQIKSWDEIAEATNLIYNKLK